MLLCVALAGGGCSALVQQQMGPLAVAYPAAGAGVVLGSVSAPPTGQYHHPVVFHFRWRGPGKGHGGVLTSASSFAFQPFMPACDEHGLPGECARLFALELPAGGYEIHRVTMADGGSGTSRDMPGWRFSVEPGGVTYLGNLHMTYCQGLVRRTRGGILGGEAVVRDRHVRDLPLLREQFPQLLPATVQKRLLRADAFAWRVSYQPHDWGACAGANEGT